MKFLFPLLVGGLLCSVSAFAQDKLSLADALVLGLERNYDLRIEVKKNEIARNNNTLGQAGFLPRLSLSVSQAHQVTNIENPTAFVGGDIVNTNITPSIQLDWKIFDGFRARASKKRLEALEAQTQGNAAIVVQNTIQAIMQGYYNVLLEKERVAVLARALALSGEKFAYVKLKKSLGSAVTSDLLLAESNWLNDSTAYLNGQLVYRESLRKLNTLLVAESTETDYHFTDTLAFAPVEYGEAALLERMTQNNVNLQTQYLSEQVLRHSTGMLRAQAYPAVGLSLNMSDNLSAQNVSRSTLKNAPQVPVTGNTFSYGATFTLTFNLFDGGKIQGAIRNALVEEKIATIRTEKLKLSLSQNMRAALDLYNSRKQLLSLASRTKKSAQLSLSISEERYKNGTINSFDYRTVQNNYTSAALSELQAVYNLIDANIKILRLSGGLVEAF